MIKLFQSILELFFVHRFSYKIYSIQIMMRLVHTCVLHSNVYNVHCTMYIILWKKYDKFLEKRF